MSKTRKMKGKKRSAPTGVAAPTVKGKEAVVAEEVAEEKEEAAPEKIVEKAPKKETTGNTEKAEKVAAAKKEKKAEKAAADVKMVATLKKGEEVLEAIYEELECPEELTHFQTLFTETGLFYSVETVYGALQKETGTPYKAGSVRAEIFSMIHQGAFAADTVKEAFAETASERTVTSTIGVAIKEGTVMEIEYKKKTYLVPFLFRVEEGLEDNEEGESTEGE